MQHILYSFFSAFSSKIGKNSQIFCNFFLLCINKLEESCKKSLSKHLTISENVVSLHRCLILNNTTKQQIK